MNPLRHISKSNKSCRVLLFSFLILLLWMIPPVHGKNRDESRILKSSYKVRPVKTTKKHSTQLAGDHNCTVYSSDAKKKPDESIQDVAYSEGFRKYLSSKSAIIMDAHSGQILYAHNPDRPGQPASTIKIITGLIAINSLQDADIVRPSRKAARQPRSKIYLNPQKNYAVDDLINAVLLASANDASVALAEKVAGSECSFAKLMTSKARSLGATNTVCKTATGLTASGQQSTARDLATLFNKAMQNREFAERIGRTKIRTRYGQFLYNHNKALWRVDGAVGGKTGYTQAARQTYVGKFSRGNTELIVALMGSETMWKDVSRLVEYGFKKERQLSAMNNGALPSTASPEGALAFSSVPTRFNSNSLQILTGTKKQPSL